MKRKKLFLILAVCSLTLTVLGSSGYLVHRHIMLPARQSKNRSLHGHNMDDGSMFAPLLQLTDYGTYQKNKTFTTLENGKVCTWEIISVFRHNPDRDVFLFAVGF